jgi:hypothetical protein
MKKAPGKKKDDELRPDYDLSLLKGGVRGKYYHQTVAGDNLVLLDPDLAAIFPDTASVNCALRLLVATAKAATATSRQRKVSKSVTSPTRNHSSRSGAGDRRGEGAAW